MEVALKELPVYLDIPAFLQKSGIKLVKCLGLTGVVVYHRLFQRSLIASVLQWLNSAVADESVFCTKSLTDPTVHCCLPAAYMRLLIHTTLIVVLTCFM